MTKHQSEAARRRQILAAARDEFIAHGFHATRVADVAKRARLSKGAIYFYYPSKRDLFLALVLAEHESSYAILEEAETSMAPALLRLLHVGRAYLEAFAGTEQPPRFFLMMTELAMRDEELREECEALHQRFVDAAARIFAQGIAEGSMRPMDPEAVARLLKALIDGIGGQAAIGIAPPPELLAQEGFTTVLRGLLVDPDEADRLLSAARAVAASAAAVEPNAAAG